MTKERAEEIAKEALRLKNAGQDYTHLKNELLRNGFGELVRQYGL